MRTLLTRRELMVAAGATAVLGRLGTRLAAAQPPKRGGTLRVATVDKPVNMDPGFAQSQRYWTKSNVQGAVPLSSVEFRCEDVWIG
jgi:hypothetical protein